MNPLSPGSDVFKAKTERLGSVRHCACLGWGVEDMSLYSSPKSRQTQRGFCCRSCFSLQQQLGQPES